MKRSSGPAFGADSHPGWPTNQNLTLPQAAGAPNTGPPAAQVTLSLPKGRRVCHPHESNPTASGWGTKHWATRRWRIAVRYSRLESPPIIVSPFGNINYEATYHFTAPTSHPSVTLIVRQFAPGTRHVFSFENCKGWAIFVLILLT